MTEPERGFAEFLAISGGLKSVPRTGWIDRGLPVERVESVADHSWRVALMAWLLSGEVEGLDRERVVLLALVHDLAESLVGDITPYDRQELSSLSPDERRDRLDMRQHRSAERSLAKHLAENAAMERLIDVLPAERAGELRTLWNELNDRATREAQFLKELDILETFMQSREYLLADPDLPVNSFLLEAQEMLHTPALQAIRDALNPTPPDD